MDGGRQGVSGNGYASRAWKEQLYGGMEPAFMLVFSFKGRNIEAVFDIPFFYLFPGMMARGGSRYHL